MIPDLLFLLFSAGILAGGALVALGKNPMVGILGMLLAFLNGSGLFILLGAEFLGLLLIMVYVGAVAVMFLFVLMTIDIDFAALREGWAPYLPLGLVTVGGLATLLILAVQGTALNVGTPVVNPEAPQNVVALGQVLFTQYAVPFQIAGLLLLVAMVGAIGLTHRPRRDIKRQDVTAQVTRKRSEAVVLTNPATGKGAYPDHWVGKGVEKKR
ncbi:MAG: NADH-quinone oxidoreductase subunit J [Alphaproteobacteria bacterium]|nr:NADH-quinone oxidoreductase subunit J [Alphaproteobacteria bacterium]